MAFDKPYGRTSFYVVGRVRYLLCKKLGIKKLKVGHAGTLDPLATGVLVICTGKAAKRIEDIQMLPKEYVATLQLGATTPTYDLERPIDATYSIAHISQQMVEQTLQRFVGTIEQVPPAFSACKVNGSRAYLLARKGKDTNLKAKTIVIREIELLHYDLPQIVIRVACGKGTYIRSLARDIGQALKSGAHLTALRRTKVGNYNADDCLSLEQFPLWLDEQEITSKETN